MLEFKNKILFVGYGAVAAMHAADPVKHIKTPAKNITVMDFEDRAAKLSPWTQARRQVRARPRDARTTWARCSANTFPPATC